MEDVEQAITKYETGRIGIYYLKKIWDYYQRLKRSEKNIEEIEWKYFNGVFNTLGVGIEPTVAYLMESNTSFEDFENWLIQNGEISDPIIKHFNAIIDQGENTKPASVQQIFSPAELEHWDEHGYIIVKDAISKTDCATTVDFIYNKLEADKNNPDTWYAHHPLKKGIMVQLFNAPSLNKNRFSDKIRLAYEQLWNRTDLMVSMDRVSFNPPETKAYQFPGPNLHWDVSLKRPIPFGLQGLLYLADTNENQGAFTLIPGFHKKINNWLEELPADQNPRDKTLLSHFETKSIAAKAGDFIIWNQCLPHGSSPNTSTKPRIVQYINYQPLNMEYQAEWI